MLYKISWKSRMVTTLLTLFQSTFGSIELEKMTGIPSIESLVTQLLKNQTLSLHVKDNNGDLRLFFFELNPSQTNPRKSVLSMYAEGEVESLRCITIRNGQMHETLMKYIGVLHEKIDSVNKKTQQESDVSAQALLAQGEEEGLIYENNNVIHCSRYYEGLDGYFTLEGKHRYTMLATYLKATEFLYPNNPTDKFSQALVVFLGISAFFLRGLNSDFNETASTELSTPVSSYLPSFSGASSWESPSVAHAAFCTLMLSPLTNSLSNPMKVFINGALCMAPNLILSTDASQTWCTFLGGSSSAVGSGVIELSSSLIGLGGYIISSASVGNAVLATLDRETGEPKNVVEVDLGGLDVILAASDDLTGNVWGSGYSKISGVSSPLFLSMNSTGALTSSFKITNLANGGQITSITRKSNDDVFLSAGFTDSPTKGLFMKIATNGTVLSSKSLSVLGTDSINGVCQTSDGGTVLAGYTGTPTKQGWVTKLDENDNVIFTRLFSGTSNVFFIDCASQDDGSIVLVGSAGTDSFSVLLTASGDIVTMIAPSAVTLLNVGFEIKNGEQLPVAVGYINGSPATLRDALLLFFNKDGTLITGAQSNAVSFAGSSTDSIKSVIPVENGLVYTGNTASFSSLGQALICRAESHAYLDSSVIPTGFTNLDRNQTLSSQTITYASANVTMSDLSPIVEQITPTVYQNTITTSWQQSTSNAPTTFPSAFPTDSPSITPTLTPTLMPSVSPTGEPSYTPTLLPTCLPTDFPSFTPSETPTIWPSCLPTNDPSLIPTLMPTILPSHEPSLLPTLIPTDFPTLSPSDIPTIWPSALPTNNPSLTPTLSPTLMPSGRPSLVPTLMPTNQPSGIPSMPPSTWPSCLPTNDPSLIPTFMPTILPSGKPSLMPTLMPSDFPSLSPSDIPTMWPSALPTDNPSFIPTLSPTRMPSGLPTLVPTLMPTNHPSALPSAPPSTWPSDFPSPDPTYVPTWLPSQSPSGEPTWRPTWVPSNAPSISPSTHLPSTNAPSSVVAYNWTAIVGSRYNEYMYDIVTVNEKVIGCGSLSDEAHLSGQGACFLFNNNNGRLLTTYTMPDWNKNTAIASIDNDLILIGQATNQGPVTARFNVANKMLDWDFKLPQVNAKFVGSAIREDEQHVMTVGYDNDLNMIAFGLNATSGDFLWGNTYARLNAKTYPAAIASRPELSQVHVVASGQRDATSGLFSTILRYILNTDGRIDSTARLTRDVTDEYQLNLATSVAIEPRSLDSVMVGSIYHQNSGMDMMIARVKASSLDWAIELSGSRDDRLTHVMIHNNAIFAVGSSSSFDYVADIIVIKLNLQGEILRAVRLGSPQQDTCTSFTFSNGGLELVISTFNAYFSQQNSNAGILFVDENLSPGSLPPGFTWYEDDVLDTLMPKASDLVLSSDEVVTQTPWTINPLEPMSHALSLSSIPQLWPVFATHRPSRAPSRKPSQSPKPTNNPSQDSSREPSSSFNPTINPSTGAPSFTYKPSKMPSEKPSKKPITSRPSARTNPPMHHNSASPSSSSTRVMTNAPFFNTRSPAPTYAEKESSQSPSHQSSTLPIKDNSHTSLEQKIVLYGFYAGVLFLIGLVMALKLRFSDWADMFKAIPFFENHNKIHPAEQKKAKTTPDDHQDSVHEGHEEKDDIENHPDALTPHKPINSAMKSPDTPETEQSNLAPEDEQIQSDDSTNAWLNAQWKIFQRPSASESSHEASSSEDQASCDSSSSWLEAGWEKACQDIHLSDESSDESERDSSVSSVRSRK